MFKKALAVCSSVGFSVLALAQDASTLDLTEYMEGLRDSTESQIETLLPLLGDIAVIGLVVFLAVWAFRTLKRFLSGR